jgi:hypothetical protein
LPSLSFFSDDHNHRQANINNTLTHISARPSGPRPINRQQLTA